MLHEYLLGSSEKLSFYREEGNKLSNQIWQILFDCDSFCVVNDKLKILIPYFVKL